MAPLSGQNTFEDIVMSSSATSSEDAAEPGPSNHQAFPPRTRNGLHMTPDTLNGEKGIKINETSNSGEAERDLARGGETDLPNKKLKRLEADDARSSRAGSPASSVEGTKSKRKPPTRLIVPAATRTTRGNTPNTAATTSATSTRPPTSVPPPSLPEMVTPTKPAPPPQPYYSSPHSVFRPPPSAALEIFTRQPAQDFRSTIQSANTNPTIQTSSPLTSLPSSNSGLASLASSSGLSSLPSNDSNLNGGAQLASTSLNNSTNNNQVSNGRSTFNPFVNGSDNGVGPLSSVSGSSAQQSSAMLSTFPPVAGPSTPTRSGASIQQPMAGSPMRGTTASPYVVKRTAKSGGRKGKAKAGLVEVVEDGILNNDYCSGCRGIGRFLCCDGCPRSFHFMCLEPPLRLDEMPAEDTWYCKECRAARIPKGYKLAPVKGFFGPLLDSIDRENPTQFRLPEDIRNFFTSVATGPDGSYEQTIDMKPVKFDRSGLPEARDAYRLKNKGKAVLCCKCQGSAAPNEGSMPQGRRMLSCDYCPLNWHLDCLNPPLANPPNPQRKWMCPNHAQHVAPKRRTLRHGVEDIIVDEPGMPNNGIVDVLDEEAERKRIAYETQYINGKRYKIPERIIQLDFWAKIGKDKRPSPTEYTIQSILGGQSPLSSPPSSPSLSDGSLSLERSSVEPSDIGGETGNGKDSWAMNALMDLHAGRSDLPVSSGQYFGQETSTGRLQVPMPQKRAASTNGRSPSSKGMMKSRSHGHRPATPPPRSSTSDSGASPARITLRISRQAIIEANASPKTPHRSREGSPLVRPAPPISVNPVSSQSSPASVQSAPALDGPAEIHEASAKMIPKRTAGLLEMTADATGTVSHD